MARAHVDIELRWGDQDAYGHVNNVAFARYLEEARVRVFWRGTGRESTGLESHFRGDSTDGIKMLVANQTIEFLKVLEYGDHPVVIEVWIGKLGGTSLELHYEIVESANAGRAVVARAITTVVTVDGVTLRPTRLDAPARAAVGAWMDDPLELRRG